MLSVYGALSFLINFFFQQGNQRIRVLYLANSKYCIICVICNNRYLSKFQYSIKFLLNWYWKLVLPVPIPEEEKKFSLIFIFTLLCVSSKGFMKALKINSVFFFYTSFWNARGGKGHLTHFISLFSFYTPWKHQKTRVFLMFSGDIERDQWHKMH